MTISGALSDLNNLLNADDIPFYYKPSIKTVMDTIALSSLEKTGHWIKGKYRDDDIRYNDNSYKCNNCGKIVDFKEKYCPNCGLKMVEPWESSDKSCSNCKYWLLDENNENRRCKYCVEMDEWVAESEDSTDYLKDKARVTYGEKNKRN